MATSDKDTRLITKKAEEGDLKQIMVTANDGSDRKDLAKATVKFFYLSLIHI